MASSASRRIVHSTSDETDTINLRDILGTTLLAAASLPMMAAEVTLSDSPGGAVSHEETSAGDRKEARRQWECIIRDTRLHLASLHDVVASHGDKGVSRLKAGTLWPADGDGEWAYTNEYIWQGLKREKRMPSLAEGSEFNTQQFFVAQKVLSIDPTATAAVLPSLAIADFNDETKTEELILQLAQTLKQLNRTGDAAEKALQAICPKWPTRFTSSSLRDMARQSLMQRFKALQAECDSWLLYPKRKSKVETRIPPSDLATIWKSLKKCDYGSKAEKIQLLKVMTKCLRKIAKVVSKKVGPRPAAVEHCVDEIFKNMPAVIEAFRCKLMKTFFLKSRLEIAGLAYGRSDLDKIKRLKQLRDAVLNPDVQHVPTTFLGVHFTTTQALEVVSYLVQQMWEEEHKALLNDWYESANALLSRSDEDGLMIWIVKTLAEVGTDRSLDCLYSLFCQARNATLVVHKDLHSFLIYQSPEHKHTPSRVVQIHTPKGCDCRAIHLVDAQGRVMDPSEVESSTLKEGFGLSLRPDFDRAVFDTH